LFKAPDYTFTLTTPRGWLLKDIGLVYPALIGPQLENYNLNLVFFEEQSKFPLAAYASSIQDNLINADQNMHKVSDNALETDEGKSFFRWETETVRDGKSYHLIVYFFESGDWKLSTTYTRPAADGVQYDAEVDAAMKSLLFEHQ
jgi:hypothetical protein